MKYLFLCCILFVFQLVRAQDADNGAKLFESYCGSCHNFKTDGIGPHLGGLNGQTNLSYLTDFIYNAKAVIDSKEPRALRKFEQFKTLMPEFSYLKPTEIQDIIAYILEQPAPVSKAMSSKGVLTNPIPAAIPKAKLSLNLKKVAEFPHTRNTQPLARLNKMLVHPLLKQSMVADLQGKIYLLDAQYAISVYMDMSQYFPNFINTPGLAVGLGSFAFHPDYRQNKLFYTSHTEKSGAAQADFSYHDSIPKKMQWVANEWIVEDIEAKTFAGKARELLRIDVPNQIHGLQEIAFNPYAKSGDSDYGLLYMGMGDGGSVEQGYGFLAKNSKNIWGKVLRIDPQGRNSQNGRYGIPAGNMYAQQGGKGLQELFAEGFRNPNRISWLKDGRMIVSNIGQHQIESLYLLEPGRHYGWPYREGTFYIDSTSTVNTVKALPANDKSFGYTYPIAQYDHDEGNAIMGGFEYLGQAIPQLKGKYIFGEIVRGRIFYINVKDIKQGRQLPIFEFDLNIEGKKTDLRKAAMANKVDLRLGQDVDGELYVMTKADAKMYKIVPNISK